MSVVASLPFALNIARVRLPLNQLSCFSISKSSCSSALQNNLKPTIAFRSPTPQHYEKKHEKHMRNRASHTDVRSPEIRSLIGYIAPDFEAEAVYNEEFVKVKLSSYIGKKYVIIFFYPLDFTLVCPTEITAFSDKYAEFQKLDTEILAISTDSVFSHLAWIQTDRKSGGLGKLSYPLVSDLTKNVAKSFRVLLPEQGIALRGLFIIDKQGIIQHGTINNFAIGRSVDEALRLLQAIQHVQSHPSEVCPVNWQPGDKAIKPDGHCPPMCGV